MTHSTEESDNRLEHINPETIANALLREAVDNAKNTGNDIRKTLIHKVGLPLWMVVVAEKVDYSNLEIWARYLRHGDLPHHKGITQAQVEMMLKIKRYLSDELMAPPDEDETRKNNFKSTIETAVLRESGHPKKSKNTNFTAEKGSADAPEYDGKDEADDIQTNLWVFATRIVQWTIDEDGVGQPGETVLRIDDLIQIYRDKQRAITSLVKSGVKIPKELRAQLAAENPGIPIQHLKYEVKDWIRHWKPGLQETYERPDKERRNVHEFYKRQEVRRLRGAVAMAQEGKASALWEIAFKYLGRSARVSVEDISFEKRIETQIRRKFNNRKLRVEGKVYLPPGAAGEMLYPMLDERVRLLVSKNPDLDDRLPWVIEVFFDAEAREELDGRNKVTAGVGIMLQRRETEENDD